MKNQMCLDNSIKNNLKLNFLDVLVIFCLIFSEAGTFGLPLNLYQFIIVFMLAVSLFNKIYAKLSIRFSSKLIILLLYMLLITIINTIDFSIIRGFLFFVIELIAFYFWMDDNQSFSKFQKILYMVSVFLSIYGIIQEIAFFFNIPQLYDLSIYGFGFKVGEIRNGILSVTSFYSEPSHCATFISWGLWIGLTGRNKLSFVSITKNICILLCAFFTQSAIVYICVFVVLIAYVCIYQKNIMKKAKWFAIAIIGVLALFLVKDNAISAVLNRLNQFENISTTTGQDLSALSLVSNFKIAVEKMKDGFIFGTGFDTHRLYYDHYISEIYGTLYMYLNINDAGSLYTRVFSEFGIIGVLIFIYFIVKKFFHNIRNNNMVGFSFILMFSILIMRNGQYENLYTIIAFLGAFMVEKDGSYV